MSLVESGLFTPQGNKAGFDYLVDLGVTLCSNHANV